MTNTENDTTPVIDSVKRHAGIAGQYAVTARVHYGNEPASDVTFVAWRDSRTVVMCTESGAQVYVSSAVIDRLGANVNEAWVRGFFA
jgi:hypothetical protein